MRARGKENKALRQIANNLFWQPTHLVIMWACSLVFVWDTIVIMFVLKFGLICSNSVYVLLVHFYGGSVKSRGEGGTLSNGS
jgi:hypothetical protein